MSEFVVIGAGQAAASLVAKLRSDGFDGGITVIGDEPALPYQRPPLSKKYLTGEMELERLYLRPASYYDDQNITMRLGAPVEAIDRAAKSVTVAGDTIAYDKLALATGSAPRMLPAAIGGDLGGVYAVRTLADVDLMATEFKPGARVLIVGGGYIGLEAAAVASTRGLDVTLIEMAPRILQRVASPETSDYFRDLHSAHGVKIMESTGLARLHGDGRVSEAELADGTMMPVDFVIAGIGIMPGDALAVEAGLTIDNGIAVDARCATSDPDIFAIGDCASFPYAGDRLRLESVGNAIDMAEIAAQAMMGADVTYEAAPWFWSDQYDVTLQIAGLNTGYTDIVSRIDGERVSFWYYKDGKLLAVDAMKDAKSYMMGKRWIAAGQTPDPVGVADASANLREIALV